MYLAVYVYVEPQSLVYHYKPNLFSFHLATCTLVLNMQIKRVRNVALGICPSVNQSGSDADCYPGQQITRVTSFNTGLCIVYIMHLCMYGCMQFICVIL